MQLGLLVVLCMVTVVVSQIPPLKKAGLTNQLKMVAKAIGQQRKANTPGNNYAAPPGTNNYAAPPKTNNYAPPQGTNNYVPPQRNNYAPNPPPSHRRQTNPIQAMMRQRMMYKMMQGI